MIPYQDQDKAIRVMASLPAGKYPVKPSQVPMIRLIWEALHSFDHQHEYTMNEQWTQITKKVRP